MSSGHAHGVSVEPLPDDGGGRGGARPLLFDISGIDRTQRAVSKADIERWIPHRGQMSLVDAMVWHSADYTLGMGIKHIRSDEFWVAGHFPDRPMLPGVLMIEAGAQMACYLYNIRQPKPKIVAFLRIEEAAFRNMVQPGDDLFILCREIKYGRRRFISDIQGLVEDRIAFDARITGMSMNE